MVAATHLYAKVPRNAIRGWSLDTTSRADTLDNTDSDGQDLIISNNHGFRVSVNDLITKVGLSFLRHNGTRMSGAHRP